MITNILLVLIAVLIFWVSLGIQTQATETRDILRVLREELENTNRLLGLIEITINKGNDEWRSR